MTDAPQQAPAFDWRRELIVPGLMLAGIVAFVGDSMHLSTIAMVLPAALIVVVIASLIWALASVLLGKGAAGPDENAVPDEDDAVPGPILSVTAWALVALPAVLFALLDILGAFVVLVALVFGAQLVFSVKTPVRSLLIALAVTVPTYAVFKYFLYVRFPTGVLGIG